MPRLARSVCAQVPHHITQRGNRREQVFFTDEDRQAYLGWLKEYAEKHAVDILAYCLMTNHIHLVAVPPLFGTLSFILDAILYSESRTMKKGSVPFDSLIRLLFADDEKG